MRVLFVLGGLRIGGYELTTVRLANAFVRRGVATAVATLTDELMTKDRLSPEVELFVVKKWAGADPSLPFRLASVLSEFRPDVIKTCEYYDYSFAQLATMLWRGKTINVRGFHVTHPASRKDAVSWKAFSVLDKLFGRKHYIAIHRSQTRFYCDNYGIREKDVTLIPNGVDLDRFVRVAPRHRNGDTFTVVNVANIKPLKDHITLLKAMVRFDRSSRQPWQLKIAGEDQTGLLPKLKGFAEKNGIAGRVSFLGHVSDVSSILADADAFVLTSKTEALPISALEAGAASVPCVLTDVGGNPDIVDDGTTGFLFPVGDFDALSGRLLRLASDPALSGAMGQRLREKVTREFAFGTMVERYLTLFERLVAQPPTLLGK
jgi:glycosyltransferase involved in cell wall biosynthesis